MKAAISGMRERWLEYQPTKTHIFGVAAVCVVATLIAGFGFAGWVSAGTAEQRAAQAAADSRHQLAAAICVEEFMAAASAPERLASLKKAAWYQRHDLVAASGWATMPDREQPNREVASMCAERLAATPS